MNFLTLLGDTGVCIIEVIKCDLLDMSYAVDYFNCDIKFVYSMVLPSLVHVC